MEATAGAKAEGEMAVGWKAELTVGVMEADVMAAEMAVAAMVAP